MDTLAFIVILLLLASLGVAAILVGFRRALRASDGEAELAPLKRRLAEIDQDHRQGLLSVEDHGFVRAEAARRLFAAVPKSRAQQEARLPPSLLVLALATPALAVVAYLLVGAPGLADEAYRARVAIWRNTEPSALTPDQMAAVLGDIAAERPADPEPLKHLALVRRAADDTPGAVQALRQAVARAPGRVDLWVELGETSVAAAKGSVDDDARWAFSEALARDPSNASARYYLARGRIADGDVAGGLAGWRALAADLPWDDPRHRALVEEIALVAARGGLPPPPAGETDQGRDAIAGMVAGLAARLDRQPDDPQGWIRLVRAYAVLEDAPRRDTALARALSRYGRQPKLAAALRQAADAKPAVLRPEGSAR